MNVLFKTLRGYLTQVISPKPALSAVLHFGLSCRVNRRDRSVGRSSRAWNWILICRTAMEIVCAADFCATFDLFRVSNRRNLNSASEKKAQAPVLLLATNTNLSTTHSHSTKPGPRCLPDYPPFMTTYLLMSARPSSFWTYLLACHPSVKKAQTKASRKKLINLLVKAKTGTTIHAKCSQFHSTASHSTQTSPHKQITQILLHYGQKKNTNQNNDPTCK